ncbi:hypothetical protein PPTG_08755 [Phytophthora nicotianae INRA-310]|uniref:Uncharacterized protein n=1 Tax=Phytophthora nicotianae (strain INRA-310) TaxID=761204 RepID=W2QK99_PHYN3|nr:hypothetical protein PPTG_08755 [Phytophthora nicotianae INRA-310]ETN12675.1 hypothetical protein PPTG_08755 [Phytophthora nicotianae INRA-310]
MNPIDRLQASVNNCTSLLITMRRHLEVVKRLLAFHVQRVQELDDEARRLDNYPYGSQSTHEDSGDSSYDEYETETESDTPSTPHFIERCDDIFSDSESSNEIFNYLDGDSTDDFASEDEEASEGSWNDPFDLTSDSD